jgi:hypothetical protein
MLVACQLMLVACQLPEGGILRLFFNLNNAGMGFLTA